MKAVPVMNQTKTKTKMNKLILSYRRTNRAITIGIARENAVVRVSGAGIGLYKAHLGSKVWQDEQILRNRVIFIEKGDFKMKDWWPVFFAFAILFCMAWILETTLWNLTKIPSMIRKYFKRRKKRRLR